MRRTIPHLVRWSRSTQVFLRPGQYSLRVMLVALMGAAGVWAGVRAWLQNPPAPVPMARVEIHKYARRPLALAPRRHHVITYSVTSPVQGVERELFIDYPPFGELDEVVLGAGGSNCRHYAREGPGQNICLGIPPEMQAVFDQIRAEIEPELDVESMGWLDQDQRQPAQVRCPLRTTAHVLVRADLPRVAAVEPKGLRPISISMFATHSPPRWLADEAPTPPPRKADPRATALRDALTAKLEMRVTLPRKKLGVNAFIRDLAAQGDFSLTMDLAVEAIGITDSRTLWVEENERPVREILIRFLVRRSPHLVYVVRDRQENGPAVFITTWEAARKQGDTLPQAPELTPVLIDILAHGSFAEQCHALATVERLGPAAKAARLAVETRCSSPDADVQQAARRALLALDGK